MGEQLVTYERDGDVGIVTMDDGKANVISIPMVGALNEALDEAERDGVVVVVEGREGRFSGGFDLGTLTGGGEDLVTLLIGGFEVAERLLNHPTPVVTSCTGHAMAMGAFLLLSGDHRVGAEGPFKITANEVAIGMTLPLAPAEICRLRLTATEFQRATLLAQVYSPSEAVGAGFLHEVVAPEELATRARDAAHRLAQLDMPSFQGTKQQVNAAALAALRSAIEADRAAAEAMIA